VTSDRGRGMPFGDEPAAKVLGARLRLAEAAARLSLQELLVATLDEAGNLSGSPIGFFHFVEPDQVTITLQAWSSRTTAEFCQAEGAGQHYAVDKAGVWADCVRLRRAIVHNDYASLAHRRPLPEGHARVVREMVVPVLRNERIVAVLGVGNKPTDYDDQDLADVSALADVAWDVASRKHMEERLRHSEAQLRAILDVVDQGIGLWNPEGRLVYANPRVRRLFDLHGSAGDLNLQDARFGLSAEDGSLLDASGFPPSRALQTGRSESATLRFVDGRGEERFILASAHPLRDPTDGTLLGAVTSISDVTDQKRREHSLEAVARHDPLTGLPNRLLLMDRLEQAMASTRRSGTILAVCFLDLDGFKSVNDRHGHAAGDELLREVGRRLKGAMRGGDTVARIGGDEFVLLLSGARTRLEIDRALGRMISVARLPVELPTHQVVTLSASVGVAAFPDDAVDPAQLIRFADAAMYDAKLLGKDRWSWYLRG
jgi:diguanylate cyclase (GGDEF)-like protein/PAS domain S-box-containing protein